MLTIFANADHALHSGRVEFFRGRLVPIHEVPARLEYVLAELARRPVGKLESTTPSIDLADLEQVHARRYLEFLQGAWDEWVARDPVANAEADALPFAWPVRGLRDDVEPKNFDARLGLYSFDAVTPLMSGTWRAALTGAACTLAAVRALGASDPPRATMALTRPPGHHAGRDYFGGYCFLNNAAIAAQARRDRNGARKVAVLDVDYHHGNGTQSVFYQRSDVLTISIHGDPNTEYPFYLGHADETGADDGEGFNVNLPLPAGTGFARWRESLMSALERIATFGADAIVVPLGVDTYEGDPISKFRLRQADFLQLGRDIASAGLPVVFTLEGGYAVSEMGVNVVNVLEGFVTASRSA